MHALTRRQFLRQAGQTGAALSLLLTACRRTEHTASIASAGTPASPGTSSYLLDLDFSSPDGQMPEAITANGFIARGTPSFDRQGMSCASGHLENSDFLPSSRAALTRQGSIVIVLERLGATYDNSWSSSSFPDSSGSTTPTQRYLFSSRNAAGTQERRVIWDGVGNKSLLFVTKTNEYAVHGGLPIYNSRYVTNQYDPDLANVTWTWRDGDHYVFVEGHLVSVFSRPETPDPDEFARIAVGGYYGSSSNRFGSYAIRRVRISADFAAPRALPVKVGFLGDSFTVAGDEGSSPSVDSVEGIDAVQAGLVLTDNNNQYNKSRGQGSWIFFLQSLSHLQCNGYFPYYRSAKNGVGFEKNQIPKAYRDALVSYKPDIIVTQGSVNDVNVRYPVADIVGHTKTILDELIDGIPNLRHILFFETFSGHQCIGLPTGWLDELKRIQSLYLRGGMHGYRGKVDYIQTYEAWGGDGYEPHFTIGSNPDNHTLTGPPPYGSGTDIHPTASGHAKMAEIIWPFLRDSLKS